MSNPRIPIMLALCGLWAAAAAGCAWTDSPAATRLLVGETRALGQGTVRSWLALGEDGTPAGLGATFTERALLGVPADTDHTLTLALPAHAAAAVPFDHVEMGWRPRGEEPKGIFDRPHFDLHFYLVPAQAREGITDPERAARPPAPEWIPASYVPTPGLTPRVGAQWIDPTAPEFNGNPFEHGFAYGFYDGQLVFLEPRVTRAFLESRPDVTQELKLPQSYARPGYYPTRYRVRYDAAAREHSIALEGLVRRP